MKNNQCIKCGHQWIPREEKPQVCPKCKSYNWNKIKDKEKGK